MGRQVPRPGNDEAPLTVDSTGRNDRWAREHRPEWAVNEARDVLERQIREEKTYAASKKHPDAEFWEKRFGWWLEE